MVAKKKPINIKKENQGKLRSKMGAKKDEKLSLAALKAKLAAAKKAGNTALVKQLVFAINARKWGK